ncbi:MAG: beta-lactamase family protein [Ruminococcaceae bacterium]|nr:beta-lactamase family protein [Oscillospiraceae bacterium]
MRLLDSCKLEYNIHEIAKYDLENDNVFGSSYVVIQNGQEVFKKHFGVMGPNEKKSVNDHTIYRIASMSKPITAIAVLILVDRGMLSLNDPVKKFLPEFKDIHITTADGTDLGIATTDMTVLHLLTHTSGIGNSKSFQMCDKDKKTVNDTVNFFAKAGLDFNPFTKQVYSAIAAFDVLVKIIETITGEDFEEFLQRELFNPCLMKDTTFSPTSEQMLRIIAMHDKKDEKRIIGKTFEGCVFGDYPFGHNLGGAGLVSTLPDYAHFVTMLLDNGKTENKQIISEKTLKLLSHPHVTKEDLPGNFNRGLGVRVVTENDESILPLGSYGWSGSYGTHFWIDPENNIACVYMKNSHIDVRGDGQSAMNFEHAVYDALV